MIFDNRLMRCWRRTNCGPGSRAAAAADPIPNVPMTKAPTTTPGFRLQQSRVQNLRIQDDADHESSTLTARL